MPDPTPPLEPGALHAAQETARNLREQLNLIVRARARALEESVRLSSRSSRASAGAADLAAISERYARQAETLQGEIASLTQLLEEQEVRVEALRADEAGA